MSEISEVMHSQDLKDKRNALNPKDLKAVKSSLSLSNSLDYIHKQDLARTKKGINLYKQGRLTPELGKKLDHKNRLNAYTTDFLTGAEYPSDMNAHTDKKIRVSKQAIKDGSFQKNVVKDIRSFLGPHETMAEDYDVDEFSSDNINNVLRDASSKGFSKQANDYLKATRQPPKNVNSFEELAKLSKPKFKINPKRNAHKNLATKPIKKEKLNQNHGRNRNINRGPSLN